VPMGAPKEGKLMMTLGTLTLEANEWVARSTSGAGAFEIRFHDAGCDIFGCKVAGTVTGLAHDIATSFHPDTGVRLEFGGAGLAIVQVEGDVKVLGSYIIGRFVGPMRYVGSADSATCTAIRWTMQPDKSSGS